MSPSYPSLFLVHFYTRTSIHLWSFHSTSRISFASWKSVLLSFCFSIFVALCESVCFRVHVHVCVCVFVLFGFSVILLSCFVLSCELRHVGIIVVVDWDLVMVCSPKYLFVGQFFVIDY